MKTNGHKLDDNLFPFVPVPSTVHARISIVHSVQHQKTFHFLILLCLWNDAWLHAHHSGGEGPLIGQLGDAFVGRQIAV